jgi:hypothetical protein
MCTRQRSGGGGNAGLVPYIQGWGALTVKPDDLRIIWIIFQKFSQRGPNATTRTNDHCTAFTHLFFAPVRSTGIHAMALWQLHRR